MKLVKLMVVQVVCFFFRYFVVQILPPKKHQGVFQAALVFVPAACGVSAVSRQTRGFFWEAFDGTRVGVF